MLAEQTSTWVRVGDVGDLIENSGVCARVGDRQVAIFLLPDTESRIFAIDNWDPLGKANVLSRGIPGDVSGELCVASPLYKHHYSLTSGACLDDPNVTVPVYAIRVDQSGVWIRTGDTGQ